MQVCRNASNIAGELLVGLVHQQDRFGVVAQVKLSVFSFVFPGDAGVADKEWALLDDN